jgi:hypothetical protein
MKLPTERLRRLYEHAKRKINRWMSVPGNWEAGEGGVR